MLELLDDFDGSPEAGRRLAQGLEAHAQRVLASRGRGDRSLVARAEEEVIEDPKCCIRLDGVGEATVRAGGRSYRGGRFETPSVAELRRRAQAKCRGGKPGTMARLWVLEGASPVTDIGALQAFAPPGSVFQVASQFNCLESAEATVVPVRDYFRDPTQGPRASVSAFAGALVRRYAATSPGGGRFVQVANGRQVNLLADLCRPGVATVHNGYLMPSTIADPPAFAQLLEKQLDWIRVGVHDGLEVSLGYDWDGQVPGAPAQTIAQVFASTLAAGRYGRVAPDDPIFTTITRQLLRGAYLGTLLAALALDKRRVVLTLVGGASFASPMVLIWESILWALGQLPAPLHRDLTVVVNGRDIGKTIAAEELRSAAWERGGGRIVFEHGRAVLDCG